jgi:hypothetical protein
MVHFFSMQFDLNLNGVTASRGFDFEDGKKEGVPH